MSAPVETVAAPAALAVLLDLDGTLLDSERLVDEVVADVLHSLGAEYSPTVAALGRGKRPLEACAAVVSALSLPLSAEELYARTEERLSQRRAAAAAAAVAAPPALCARPRRIPTGLRDE